MRGGDSGEEATLPVLGSPGWAAAAAVTLRLSPASGLNSENEMGGGTPVSGEPGPASSRVSAAWASSLPSLSSRLPRHGRKRDPSH